MKIEVWSDFVCPFCYIGKTKFELALEQFAHKDEVDVEFKSFELDPNSSPYSGKGMTEALVDKYGMSLEQARAMNEDIGKQAASVGLTFHFDTMKPTNTFDAHRLVKYAETFGKEKVVTNKLFQAYFTDGKNLSDHEVLGEIAQDAGLDATEAVKALSDGTNFANEVRSDEGLAQRYGVRGVPYFIINQKYAISGAQPPEAFANALEKVWTEENVAPQIQDLSTNHDNDTTCSDGSCAVPKK